jgi:PAS domain S-box-containing protein
LVQGVISAGIVPEKILEAISSLLIFTGCLTPRIQELDARTQSFDLGRKPSPNLANGMIARDNGVMDRFPSLTQALAQSLSGDDLFDSIPDTVYFLKDRDGRYTAVNQTLVVRTGRRNKSELIGRKPDEVFPGDLGRRIAEQDRAIMNSGRMLAAELELHLYASGSEGWCLTWKSPLRDAAGAVAGLFGMSRDVKLGNESSDETRALSDVLCYARQHLDQSLRISDLATRAGLSIFQFDQRVRLLFGVSAGQYVSRLRIDHARDRLRHSSAPISEIALECGYADQTAFSRQFRKIVQLTPQKYRMHRYDAHGRIPGE